MGADPSPTETFALVGNETRMAILRTLADAFRESPTDPFLDYSDLGERVGVRDKGNFNYHLDSLGDLVLDEPAGYAITSVGMALVSAAASGSLDPEWAWGPRDVPGECAVCGDGLALRYENGHLLLTCGVDDHTLLFPVAPSLLDGYSGEDLLERVAFVLAGQAAQIRRGICSECQGGVSPEIVPDPDPRRDEYFLRGDCRGCGYQHGFPVGAAALDHPEVVAAFAAADVDVSATPFWTLEWCRVGRETVVSADPLRVSVDVGHPDGTLSVTFDRNAAVVSTERHESGD